MVDNGFLERLAALDAVFEAQFPGESQRASETFDDYAFTFYTEDLAAYRTALAALQPYADLLSLSTTFELENATAGFELISTGGLRTLQAWEIDEDLTVAGLTAPAQQAVPRLAALFVSPGIDLPAHEFFAAMEILSTEHVGLAFFATVSIDKQKILAGRLSSPGLHVFWFFSSLKLADELHKKSLAELEALLLPPGQPAARLVILLGDAQGFQSGPLLSLLGRDHWQPAYLPAAPPPDLVEQIAAAVKFRDQECVLDLPLKSLFPEHLHLEPGSLSSDDVAAVILRRAVELMLTCLASRTRLVSGSLHYVFHGYKQVEVQIPPAYPAGAEAHLYRLYAWGYTNANNDKLNILRQIISLQLSADPGGNFLVLANNVPYLIRTANSNFEFFRKRSIALYFENRLKVSDYLRKFNQAIGTAIKELTNNLVGDLYKTVGVVIGALIAALVDPNRTLMIVRLSAGLYAMYILLVAVINLFSTFTRLQLTREEFNTSTRQLEDVLLPDEIEAITSPSYRHNLIYSQVTFWVVVVVYAALLLFALLIFLFTFLA
ncbi:MAG: hypothetical protein ACK2UW_21805 [Anaerolineales bacterium]